MPLRHFWLQPRPPNDTFANHTVPVMCLEGDPLTLTHPNMTLHVHGCVVVLTSGSFPSLSAFVTLYFEGESPRMYLSTHLLPGVTIGTDFPASIPHPQVMRNVTIKDMKARPLTAGTMLASGMVFANLVLPRGMDMALQVDTVYPQLLVCDSPAPDDGSVGTEGPRRWLRRQR